MTRSARYKIHPAIGVARLEMLPNLITSPRDFDQLIQVTLDHDLSAEELLKGHRVTIPSRANTADERITSTVGRRSTRRASSTPACFSTPPPLHVLVGRDYPFGSRRGCR